MLKFYIFLNFLCFGLKSIGLPIGDPQKLVVAFTPMSPPPFVLPAPPARRSSASSSTALPRLNTEIEDMKDVIREPHFWPKLSLNATTNGIAIPVTANSEA